MHAVRYAIFPVCCPIPDGMVCLSALIAQPCHGWLPLSDAAGITPSKSFFPHACEALCIRKEILFFIAFCRVEGADFSANTFARKAEAHIRHGFSKEKTEREDNENIFI